MRYLARWLGKPMIGTSEALGMKWLVITYSLWGKRYLWKRIELYEQPAVSPRPCSAPDDAM
jgi:hypothetical protein